jgi:hypothetical protein
MYFNKTKIRKKRVMEVDIFDSFMAEWDSLAIAPPCPPQGGIS